MPLKKITTSSLLISLSLIFGKIEFPNINGGSITLFSMVPIIILSFKYGYKWGGLCGIMYGFLHLFITNTGFKGLNPFTIILTILLDYVVAYFIIGLTSLSTKLNLKSHQSSIIIGIISSFFLRLVVHYIAGVTIWSNLLPLSTSIYLYSLIYNVSYIIPEMIINLIGALIINKIHPSLFVNN